MREQDPVRVTIIVASTRDGRFGPVVAKWLAQEAAARHDLDVDLLDLAETRLPDVLAPVRPPEVAAVSKRVAAADAFVVITPEYNHSFPAPLKTMIDWHDREWWAKPVAFVSYGGRAGGARAVEQLRQVFAELHAVTVREAVSFAMARSQFEADGKPRDAHGAGRAARVMLDQLVWWADALRNARRTRPYGEPRRMEAA